MDWILRIEVLGNMSEMKKQNFISSCFCEYWCREKKCLLN